MNLNFYCRTPEFPPYDTLGNTTASGDPNLAHAWVAFDYGDGGFNERNKLLPGIANEATAQYLARTAVQESNDPGENQKIYRPKVPIFAQILVAQALKEQCPGIEESGLLTVVGEPTEDGKYIDSWAVACQARENTLWARAGDRVLTPEQWGRYRQKMPIRRIAVAAVAQHVNRAKWQTQRAYYKTAEVFIPKDLPQVYAGPESTQNWTTSALAWWPRETAARALCWIKGGAPLSFEDVKALPGLAASWLDQKILTLSQAGKRLGKRLWNMLVQPIGG